MGRHLDRLDDIHPPHNHPEGREALTVGITLAAEVMARST
jgi:hypothetical protein